MRRALTALALLALAAAAPAQLGSPDLAVHHSFPEAGRPLRIVVEGLVGSTALVTLEDAFTGAPPSVAPFLIEQLGEHEFENGALTVQAPVDELGLLVLSLPLDGGDAGRWLGLRIRDVTLDEILLQLVVHPPMILVPTERGLARIDLLAGRLIEPYVPGRGGLRGAALSPNGLSYYLLRDAGLLETGSAVRWDLPRPLRQLDAAGHDLASSRALGPAFVVVRPEGAPFAPPGRIVFLEGSRPDLLVEQMSRPVDGRRWVLSDDGLTAFIAEDELLVREVDLVRGAAGAVFTAGFPADRAIADMAWQDGRLLVATRRPEGRSGGITVFDLSTGWLMSPLALVIDPLRLVDVGASTTLVVPAVGPLFEVLEAGVPVSRDDLGVLGIESLLDAAPVEGGALLLAKGVDGSMHLLRWDLRFGSTLLEIPGVPAATRLVGAGHPVAVLLGGPGGAVHRVDLAAGRIDVLDGVRTDADAPFVMLP